ncbi:MAG: hypothetical protein KH061_05670 [Faecalibacterium prausnitzii]|nr:hypothetical protein [Faecalibacterium prausnitzii]
MKLFKKVLAAALAGVLALSVLTGCGSGSGTVDYTPQVVKALNNLYAEEGITVTEGDAAMKTKLKQFMSKVLDSDVSFDGVTDIIEAITEDEKLAAEIKKMFPTAVLDDSTKPLYNIGMVQIEQSINDSNIKRYAQEMVDDNSVELNYPDVVGGDDFDEGLEWTAVVTTVTINNQEYLVGLLSRQVYTLAVEE